MSHISHLKTNPPALEKYPERSPDDELLREYAVKSSEISG